MQYFRCAVFQTRFDQVIHHLRHPLAAIPALMTSDTVVQRMSDGEVTVRWALRTWVLENEKLDLISDFR
jgi:2-C-methyl-D-erythritol 4-phosphate cytidylyltransferase